MKYIISYKGNYKTKLRVRFATYKNVYFSNEYIGLINLNQFETPKFLINKGESLNNHFLKSSKRGALRKGY